MNNLYAASTISGKSSYVYIFILLVLSGEDISCKVKSITLIIVVIVVHQCCFDVAQASNDMMARTALSDEVTENGTITLLPKINGINKRFDIKNSTLFFSDELGLNLIQNKE